MRMSKLIIEAFVLYTPFFISAQAHLGDWTYELNQPNGTVDTVKLTIQNNGIILGDFGNDGTIDSYTVYTIDNDKITIQDVNTDSPCYDVIGVYELRIKGNTNTVRAVHDPCELRRNGHNDIQMKRPE